MAQVWETPLTPTEKLVLLALADCANDTGECWPSIATISRKAGVGERTVQRSIQSMKGAGHLTRKEVTGRGCRYYIHPRHVDTPAELAPPPQATEPPPQWHPTPATVAPKPSKNHHEPSITAKAVRRADDFPCPDGVDQIDWNALKANRKAKRAALSEGAYRQIIKKLDGWQQAGWPPGPIVAYAAERGWTTVFETDEMKVTANGNGNRKVNGKSIEGRSSLARAIDEGLDWIDQSQASVS